MRSILAGMASILMAMGDIMTPRRRITLPDVMVPAWRDMGDWPSLPGWSSLPKWDDL